MSVRKFTILLAFFAFYGLSGCDDKGDAKHSGSSSGGRNSGDGWPANGQIRQDVAVAYNGDDPKNYVPANVAYNGQLSGADCLFKFYMQRISPAPMRTMVEITEALGKGVDNTNTVEKFCRCGQVNEFFFFWEHRHGRKGALHSGVYDMDVKQQGDWIVSHTPIDEKWYNGNLTQIPTGEHSFFFGADTENPTGFLETNPEGQGYLRTWAYAPNSSGIGYTKEHVWQARDEMRLGITCDISLCPADVTGETSIAVKHHFSHDENWLLP